MLEAFLFQKVVIAIIVCVLPLSPRANQLSPTTFYKLNLIFLILW